MDGHDHMQRGSSTPMAASSEGTFPAAQNHRHGGMMTMHTTFFWGGNAEILFHGWPGLQGNLGMYVVAVLLVFSVAFVVEFLSHCNLIRGKTASSSRLVVEGLLRTLLYTVRAGLAYMVMLAVMSFNGGVFLAAVAGHGVGFFLFGSRVFNTRSTAALGNTDSDLPSMNCC